MSGRDVHSIRVAKRTFFRWLSINSKASQVPSWIDYSKQALSDRVDGWPHNFSRRARGLNMHFPIHSSTTDQLDLELLYLISWMRDLCSELLCVTAICRLKTIQDTIWFLVEQAKTSTDSNYSCIYRRSFRTLASVGMPINLVISALDNHICEELNLYTLYIHEVEYVMCREYVTTDFSHV